MIVSDRIFWRMLRFFQFDRIYRILKGTSRSSLEGSTADIPRTNIPIHDKELESKFRLAWTRLLEMGVSPGHYVEFCHRRGRALACMLRVVDKLELSQVRLVSIETASHALHEFGAQKDDFESGRIKTPEADSTDAESQPLADNHVIEASLDDCLSGNAANMFGLNKANIIMIDCEQYEATKKALNFAASLILDYAMIFVNNGGGDNDPGENAAYTEFLENNGHLKSLCFRTYKPSGRIFCVTSVKLD